MHHACPPRKHGIAHRKNERHVWVVGLPPAWEGALRVVHEAQSGDGCQSIESIKGIVHCSCEGCAHCCVFCHSQDLCGSLLQSDRRIQHSVAILVQDGVKRHDGHRPRRRDWETGYGVEETLGHRELCRQVPNTGHHRQRACPCSETE